MSVQRRRLSTFSRTFLVALSFFGLLTAAAVAQVDCGDAGKITRLGNPNTRFSSPVTSTEALQNLFANSRADVTTLLAQAGFQGNADDFLAAVASGDNVTATTIDPGTKLAWMFARKDGNAELKRNVCWAGKEPFKAFEVQFSSQGTWYSFVVPEACGNLSFMAQQTEPVCKVTIRDTAGETCAQRDLIIDASGSTGSVVVELTSPSGKAQTLTSGNSSGSLKWTVASDETKGSYRVVVRSSERTARGSTLECSATETVARACCIADPPTISLAVAPTSVELFEDAVFTALPAVSDCTTIEDVTIDGSSVNAPYEITRNYPEPGTYTVPATVADGRGQSARTELDLIVTDCVTKDCKKKRKAYRKEPGGTGAWIVRAWLGSWDAEDEALFSQGDEREAFRLDNGSGFGIQAERLFSDRIGLGFGVLAMQAAVHYELDFPNAWGMDEDDASALTLFVGPVFHLTPGSPVDVIISPFVGYTDFGSAGFSTLGRAVSADFESEFSFGAQLGLDIPFGGSGWGAHAGLIYQALDMESEGQGFTFDADPLSLNVGLSFRF